MKREICASIIASAIVSVSISLLVALKAKGVHSDLQLKSENSPSTIQLSGFHKISGLEIVDNTGKPRILVGPLIEVFSHPGLKKIEGVEFSQHEKDHMREKAKEKSAPLSVWCMAFLDQEGTLRGMLGIPANGEDCPELRFYGKDSEEAAMLSSGFFAKDSNGEVHVDTTFVSIENTYWESTFRPDSWVIGKPLDSSKKTEERPDLIQVDVNDGSPLIRVNDSKGDPRAILGTVDLENTKTGSSTTTAPSSLVLFDKEGKVIWRAPRD